MEKLKLYSQLNKIQKWLDDNDYKVNKFLLGEYTADDERWLTYQQERSAKLQEYNDIELRIKEITDAEIAYTRDNKERIKQERLDALKEPEPITEEIIEEVIELTESELLEDIIEDETT